MTATRVVMDHQLAKPDQTKANMTHLPIAVVLITVKPVPKTGAMNRLNGSTRTIGLADVSAGQPDCWAL